MLVPLFHEKSVRAALNVPTSQSSSSRARYERKLTSYFEVVNYLLATYETGDSIAETHINIMNFK